MLFQENLNLGVSEENQKQLKNISASYYPCLKIIEKKKAKLDKLF